MMIGPGTPSLPPGGRCMDCCGWRCATWCGSPSHSLTLNLNMAPWNRSIIQVLVDIKVLTSLPIQKSFKVPSIYHYWLSLWWINSRLRVACEVWLGCWSLGMALGLYLEKSSLCWWRLTCRLFVGHAETVSSAFIHQIIYVYIWYNYIHVCIMW